ncbi:uncharacterized protein LOC134239820, partial [Saccostrea cucullata]|uniref:uncharacterized protein LOC134239820 n=1 Tax=Saccostrea cuccullata TaxID=36930 RepID=UPI002ED5445D
MDENEDLLKDLIKHAKKRPEYARMVSWEFKNETKMPNRKKKQLQKESLKEQEASKAKEEKDKKFSSSSAQKEEFDSESSYYSAEEGMDSEESTGSLEEAVDEINLQNEVGFMNFPSQTNTRHRAPSKKQKRKRRYQMTYCDQILPFMNCGLSIEEDIQEVVSEIQGKQITVLREVPSLSFLCIKMLRGVRFPSDSMPHLIKSQIYGANTDLQFKKFQYGWLLNMLAFVEKKEENYLYWERKPGFNEFSQVSTLPMCSVWYSLPYVKGSSTQFTNVYNKNKVTACMMYTSGHAICPPLLQYDSHSSAAILQYMPWFLSVLGTLIECMLPSQISWRKLKGKVPYQSEEAHLRMAAKTAGQQIKHTLSKRLPKIVKEFFDVALPYAFWARGDIQHATELFCQLSQSEKRYRYRAAFLNEAGRMHAISGETTSAVKFYRLASEATLSKPQNTQHAPEIEGQAMMLLANLNDQG